MYSEEHFVKNNFIFLTIIYIVYNVGILLVSYSLSKLLIFLAFCFIIHNLGLRFSKWLLLLTIGILLIHSFCGKLVIFVLPVVLISGAWLYFANVNKKDLLHATAFFIRNTSLLYALLFILHLVKYSWQELKNSYQLSKEFNPQLFYRHFMMHLGTSVKTAYYQASVVENIYHRRYYGYAKKKRG